MLRSNNSIYSNTHKVEVNQKCGSIFEKNVFIQVFENGVFLELKLRDTNEYSFNYTAKIDWNKFEKLKNEQILEISFEEFKMQIVELLQQSLRKEMLLKLETYEDICKIIFYEKSRIKCLIFLTVDLMLTNQKEIIDEMGSNLQELKGTNKKLANQISILKCEINEKEMRLRNAQSSKYNLEKQFCKDVQLIENSFVKLISCVEKTVSEKLQKIHLRHLKLICDLERVKSDNKLKCESSTRLVQSLQNLRVENEKQFQTIRNLQIEIENLSMMRTKVEKNGCDLKQALVKKDVEISDYQKQIAELRKDIQDATKIIAQKSKTHDELAKDLVQANTMIVSFNIHCDTLAQELEKVKAALKNKEKLINEQVKEISRVSEEFRAYKQEFQEDEVKNLRHELLLNKQKIEELEKQNREAAKLNGILTKRLASGDSYDSLRTFNWTQSK